MNDLDFVIALHRTETHALGFIPKPTIRDRFIAPGNYVLIRDRHGHRRGYLIHAPPRPGLPCRIHQACVEADYRLRGFAAAAVATIARRATVADATELLLHCATDLPAIAFWQSIGFAFRTWNVGGRTRQRVLAELFLPLQTAAIPARAFATW